jgi:hypothetical protein
MATLARMFPIVGVVALGACGVAGRPAQSDAVQSCRPPDDGPNAKRSFEFGRRLILGRVVNLETMVVEGTVTAEAPDEELNDPRSDFAVVMLIDGRMEAYRPSTGGRLWSRPTLPPCRWLTITEVHVYAECNGDLVSFDRTDGTSKVLENDADLGQIAVAGSAIVALHERGVVSVFDARTNKRLARKVLPAFYRSPEQVFVTTSAVDGLCFYGLHWTRGNRWYYDVGCSDQRLTPMWSKRVSFDLATPPGDREAAPHEAVRQDGPYHLVLDDQLLTTQREGPGKGLIVRWRDGAVIQTTDRTFATIEDPRGERLTADAIRDVFTQPSERHRRQEEFYSERHARIASDGHRTFALIVNGSSRLTGIDVERGQPLFTVAVPIGMLGHSVAVMEGLPIVTTKLSAGGIKARASIHDPLTGRVLYEDERPSH